MNLTVPAAAAALETAFLDMLRAESGGFGAFESEARSVALSCCAEAMSARSRNATASSRRPGRRASACTRAGSAPSPRCAATSASRCLPFRTLRIRIQ